MKKTISTTKPETPPSRFAQAREFAEVDKTSTTEDKKGPALRNPKTEETFRENFDLDVSLGKEMRVFLLESKKFKTKREFLTQCLKDGLKKYAGQ